MSFLCIKRDDVSAIVAKFDALKHDTKLKELRISSIEICTEVAFALVNVLKYNATLTSLDLRDFEIGHDGISALADVLKHNKTITSLNLSSEYRSIIDDIDAIVLADALKHNSALTTLDLSKDRIGDNGAVALATALKCNSTLTSLDLHDCTFGYDGITAIADALKCNTTLITLNLSNSDDLSTTLTDSAIVLADALKHNTTLTELDLSKHRICDNGAVSLADALKVNSTLIKLDLRDCGYICYGFGLEGISAMSDMLKVNSTLTSLQLGESIDDFEASYIANGLYENLSIICPVMFRGEYINRWLIDGLRDPYLLLESLINRNVRYRNNTRTIVLMLIHSRKTSDLRILPREIVTMIAKIVWKNRCDTSWLPMYQR